MPGATLGNGKMTEQDPARALLGVYSLQARTVSESEPLLHLVTCETLNNYFCSEPATSTSSNCSSNNLPSLVL